MTHLRHLTSLRHVLIVEGLKASSEKLNPNESQLRYQNSRIVEVSNVFNTLIIYVCKPRHVILIYTSNKKCVSYHIPHSERRNTNKSYKEITDDLEI